MNHSISFIREFVDSMGVVMDRSIRDHIHTVDNVIGRKRLFALLRTK